MKYHEADPETAHCQPSAALSDREYIGDTRGLATVQQSAWQAAIDQSPRMLAQRRALQATFGSAPQRQQDRIEDEVPLQGLHESAPVQRIGEEPRSSVPFAAAARANGTGMPNQLKAGIEALSGMDLSDVRVHRNSGKPVQMNALAYAQGNDIHLGPGQEKHLPHEAWHVVQQRQGRVRQTAQMAGVGVNDEVVLEREADVMGAQATGVGKLFWMRKSSLANRLHSHIVQCTKSNKKKNNANVKVPEDAVEDLNLSLETGQPQLEVEWPPEEEYINPIDYDIEHPQWRNAWIEAQNDLSKLARLANRRALAVHDRDFATSIENEEQEKAHLIAIKRHANPLLKKVEEQLSALEARARKKKDRSVREHRMSRLQPSQEKFAVLKQRHEDSPQEFDGPSSMPAATRQGSDVSSNRHHLYAELANQADEESLVNHAETRSREIEISGALLKQRDSAIKSARKKEKAVREHLGELEKLTGTKAGVFIRAGATVNVAAELVGALEDEAEHLKAGNVKFELRRLGLDSYVDKRLQLIISSSVGLELTEAITTAVTNGVQDTPLEETSDHLKDTGQKVKDRINGRLAPPPKIRTGIRAKMERKGDEVARAAASFSSD